MTPARTPVLLLPGSLCDARLFGPQVAALRDRRVQVADVGCADHVGAIAAAVLCGAPARFALAGLSMGGIVAFEIWRRAPQRVAGLAIMGSTSAAESAEVAARRRAEVRDVQATGTGGVLRLVRETCLPRYFAERHRRDASLHDLVLQMAASCGPAVLVRQWQALMSRPDSRATLATIDCPALVLCGAEDGLCPVVAHQEMAAAIGVPCHVLDGCGHLATLEAPGRTTDLLHAWLREVDVAEASAGVTGVPAHARGPLGAGLPAARGAL